MSRVIGTIFLMICLPLLAAAQNADHKGQGYVYFAPGVGALDFEAESEGTLHLGAGGEGFFTRNLGVGADVGYLAPFEAFSEGLGTFSPNFVARFPSQSGSGKVEPFVAGGYTLFFRSGIGHGFNFGGGLNYWFKERLGLRFEVRDNVGVKTERGFDDTVHFVGFRIGLTFR